ncbi:MAG: sdhD [Proteobacteria bacterium]|nr:sdhD [Pseudomonadota bacterium]
MGDGTTIGQVRGLGPAHEGTSHWTAQRYTALGNIFLGAWLVVSVLLMRGNLDLASVADWLSGPIPGTAMILFIACTFYHARLGLQVLVEDYVHNEGTRFALIVLLNLVVIAAATFGIFCVLKLALGGSVL